MQNLEIMHFEETIINMTVESWRFTKLFLKIIGKLDPNEANRYLSQLRYFQKSIENNLEQHNLKIINLEGMQYDIGMAATPINIDDFQQNDILFVEQMIEPLIMGQDGIKKQGTILLAKVEK